TLHLHILHIFFPIKMQGKGDGLFFIRRQSNHTNIFIKRGEIFSKKSSPINIKRGGRFGRRQIQCPSIISSCSFYKMQEIKKTEILEATVGNIRAVTMSCTLSFTNKM